MNESDIPELFQGSRDYRFVGAAVEDGHATFQEQKLYEAIMLGAVKQWKKLGRPLVVCDLCSATGGCAEHVEKGIPISTLYLVDNEPTMIAGAKAKPWAAGQVQVIEADAVTWNAPEPIDLILMNSAYHHIEDDRKQEYLRNARRMLGPDGLILVGEHFLPEYDRSSRASYQDSVLRFYGERLRYLERLGTPEAQVAVIRQTARYCWLREYEFQVSSRLFRSDVETAQLTIIGWERVWPEPGEPVGLPADSGSHYVELHAL
jgi:ubiquinone/menaquinone biosynthesis C-methylase UbiE